MNDDVKTTKTRKNDATVRIKKSNMNAYRTVFFSVQFVEIINFYLFIMVSEGRQQWFIQHNYNSVVVYYYWISH